MISDTFWGFVIQKIIGEDDSNLTNMFEKMLKPQTIVLECEFLKETRFIYQPSKPSDERSIEWSSWWAGTTARKPSIQSALSNACALHASIQEDTSPAYVRSLLESWWNDRGPLKTSHELFYWTGLPLGCPGQEVRVNSVTCLWMVYIGVITHRS